jgi:hypothetical protein
MVIVWSIIHDVNDDGGVLRREISARGGGYLISFFFFYSFVLFVFYFVFITLENSQNLIRGPAKAVWLYKFCPVQFASHHNHKSKIFFEETGGYIKTKPEFEMYI